MALLPYRDEELNFFKFSSIVLNEFPKALRQAFKTMWDNNFGHRPGFQLWDDSIAVRHLFVSTEGGTTKVPTHHSYTEWDCTALFQATIYARSFALHHKTLSELYVKPRGVPHGNFHASVVSPGGNNAETFALAIDQLRLLRNSLCHSTSSEIDKVTFDQYVQYAKDAFQALGAPTTLIDAVERLTESDFPTNEVRRLEQRTREETRAYIKFLEGVNSDIIELRSLSVTIKQKMESETANKEDVALLERKIDDLKITQEERDDKEAQTYTKILEGVSSDIDEIKQKVQCDTANKEYIAMLQQKNSELKAVQDERDALLRNSEATRPSLRCCCLPAMVPNFTGRQRECDEIVRHVTSQSTRIISIWGSPGFGKTSVAIAVGHSIQSKQLPVCWLSLRGLHSKVDLASKLLSFVRQPTDNQNATRNLSRDDELCQVFAEISDRCVFVLDNADDLLESVLPKVKEEVIELLEEILRRNENATFIVTTRESFQFMDLHFQGHKSVRIRPLEEASSRSLVHEMLQNASTSESTRISQICGHVPLAIKLLCSSISEDNAQPSQFLKDFLEFSTESIVEMLDNPDYPANQRLQFLFDSSFRRLSEGEKETLVSLSVLPEKFDTEIAAAVLGKTQILTKKILQSLGRKSLLDSRFGPRPFTMHKLIQSFAREWGEHQMKAIFLHSKARLCAYYVSLFDKLNEQFLTGHAMSAFIAFYEDKQNIVQSLIDGCLDSETADCVFDVLVKAEMFLDSIFWTHPEATNFDLIYDSALKAASRYGKTFYFRRLLASKAFSQITWGAKGMTLQLLSEVNEIVVAAYPVTSDEKAKCLCYFGICQLVTGKTEIGVQSLQEALSLMDNSPEQTILRLVIFQILAVYYQVKNNLSSLRHFYRKAFCESRAIGDEQLLVIPAIERTTVKTNDKKVTQRCTDTLINRPLELQVIYHVKLASQHFPHIETNKSLRGILLKTLNDVEAALPYGASGLFNFHRVVATMLLGSFSECRDKIKEQTSRNETPQEQSGNSRNNSAKEYSASSSKIRKDPDEGSRVGRSEALQSRQRAMDIAVKRFGAEHESTADSYHALAITQYALGNFSSALQSTQRALNIRCALFGENHTSTADSYRLLGATQRQLGDLSSALQCEQRTLNIRRALFGEDHSSTADSYHALAITQYALGDFSSALQSTQRALNIRCALFLENHSSTADSYRLLGATQRQLGDPSSALQCEQRTLNIRRALFGEDHSSTADSYQLLGAIQHQLGDFSSALQSTQRALNIRCALFGENHASTADSYRLLGATQRQLGDLSSALQCEQHTLNIRRALFGEDHSSTADSYQLLGAIQHRLGDFVSAFQCKQRMLDIRRKVFKEEHESIADSYAELSCTQLALNDFSAALVSNQRALDIHLKMFGDGHSRTAYSFLSLASTHYLLGDFLSALEYAECALCIIVRLFGEEHTSTADGYYLLGNIHFMLGNYTLARQFHQSALNIRLRQLGEEHESTALSYLFLRLIQFQQSVLIDTADTHLLLGGMELAFGDLNAALQDAQLALSRTVKLCGEEHESTANGCLLLGVIQFALRDFTSALQYHQRALDIRLKLFGDEHSSTAYSFYLFGLMQRALGDFTSALEYAECALSIRLRLFGEEHASTVDCYLLLATIQLQLGNVPSGFQYIQRSLNFIRTHVLKHGLFGKEH